MNGRSSRRQLLQGVGVVGLGLLAGCGRWPGQAPPARTPRIGVLFGSTGLSSSPQIIAFRHKLAELGYTEGQDIAIEQRAADGHADRLPELAAELVRLPVDIMVAAGDPAIRAAQQADDTIPIVMAASRDPVSEGFVNSLAQPGGNVTGLSFFDAQLGGKRLELLKEAVPTVSLVGILGTSTQNPEYRVDEEIAGALGVQLQLLEVRSPHDLAAAFDEATRVRVDALIVGGGGSPTNFAYASWIVDEALKKRLPLMAERRDFVQAGGLMAYGPSIPDLWRRAAYYVDRILKGAKPADLPVEQPMRFDFVVNMKTARELGITFPPEILLQVTEVIQ
jgi:putative tryptophan/tyrosine transport system substrate-binding protein